MQLGCGYLFTTIPAITKKLTFKIISSIEEGSIGQAYYENLGFDSSSESHDQTANNPKLNDIKVQNVGTRGASAFINPCYLGNLGSFEECGVSKYYHRASKLFFIKNAFQ